MTDPPLPLIATAPAAGAGQPPDPRALPEITDLRRTSLRAGDVLVAHLAVSVVSAETSAVVIARLGDLLGDIAGQVKIVVLGADEDLEVIRIEE